MSQSKDEKEFDILLPGREVELFDGELRAKVFPIGIRHIRKFSSDLSRVAGALATIKYNPSDKPEEVGRKMIMQLTPYLIENLLDLILECVTFDKKVKADDLPHWELPKLVDAWIDLSFNSKEKIQPWIAMIDRTVTNVTKEEFSLLDTLSHT